MDIRQTAAFIRIMNLIDDFSCDRGPVCISIVGTAIDQNLFAALGLPSGKKSCFVPRAPSPWNKIDFWLSRT